MKVALLCLVSFLLLAAPPGRAAAGHPEAEQNARRLFERAEEHFKAGLFAEALGEYQQGYEELPLPGFLINIAQCQRRLGDLQQAQATYRKFIMVAPDSPYVPEVKDLVAELDKLIEATEAEQPAAPPPPEQAQAEPAGAASLVPPPMPAPPPEPVASPLVEAEIPPAPPPPPRSETRWWLWGTVGAAVLLGAAGTTAYLLSSPNDTTVHDGSLGTLRR